jgi:hypothetical protein
MHIGERVTFLLYPACSLHPTATIAPPVYPDRNRNPLDNVPEHLKHYPLTPEECIKSTDIGYEWTIDGPKLKDPTSPFLYGTKGGDDSLSDNPVRSKKVTPKFKHKRTAL